LLKSLKMYEITDLSVAIQITAHVLGYMNSCVNPLIYSVLSENFRKAFRKVIQCQRLLNHHHNHTNTLASPHAKPRPSCVPPSERRKASLIAAAAATPPEHNQVLLGEGGVVLYAPAATPTPTTTTTLITSNNGTTTTITISSPQMMQGTPLL
jgi:hypothetical protein